MIEVLFFKLIATTCEFMVLIHSPFVPLIQHHFSFCIVPFILHHFYFWTMPHHFLYSMYTFNSLLISSTQFILFLHIFPNIYLFLKNNSLSFCYYSIVTNEYMLPNELSLNLLQGERKQEGCKLKVVKSLVLCHQHFVLDEHIVDLF